MSKYYIEDYSLFCSLGLGKEEVGKQLFSKQARANEKIIALTEDFSSIFFEVSQPPIELAARFNKYNSRNNQIAYTCLKEMEVKIRKRIQDLTPQRVAVVCASSTSAISNYENHFIHRQSPSQDSYLLSQQEMGNLSDFVSDYFQVSGPSYTVSTACSSGAKAFAEAIRLLDSNLCDAVIVGGCDSYCELTLKGFHSLEAVSKNRCLPFSKNRTGINIGEGAAFFLLSKKMSEFELLSVGESSDAYHISSPEPEGIGAERAIQQALEKAYLKPEDISYINLHGTATIKNDEMEARLINRVFGPEIPVSSTKSLVGHCLGAAGSIETAFCLLTLSTEYNPDRLCPLHWSDHEFDPTLPSLNFVDSGSKLKTTIAMSNSFAFGGNNASVIVRSL